MCDDLMYNLEKSQVNGGQTMQLPVLTPELAARIEQADLDVMQGRLVAAQKREGNPLNIEIRRFGNATALLTPGIPIIDFNKVLCFGPDEMPLLDEIINFYEQHGMEEFGITIIPSRTSPELLAAMVERGMYQYGFHTAFYGLPEWEPAEANPHVVVREIKEEEIPTFAELFVKSFNVPPHLLASETENLRGLYGQPEWRMYLAFVEEQAAGFALMQIREEVACLALAGTLEEWRGRGVQTALLERRLVDAKEAGCGLLVSQASYGSASARNMQKVGLQVAFTQAEWKWKKTL